MGKRHLYYGKCFSRSPPRTFELNNYRSLNYAIKSTLFSFWVWTWSNSPGRAAWTEVSPVLEPPRWRPSPADPPTTTAQRQMGGRERKSERERDGERERDRQRQRERETETFSVSCPNADKFPEKSISQFEYNPGPLALVWELHMFQCNVAPEANVFQQKSKRITVCSWLYARQAIFLFIFSFFPF